MSEIKLGQLIDGDAERDAIHVAIAPVVAGEVLIPGQHVGFVDDSNRKVWGRSPNLVGVVDPFLTDAVRVGQWVYLLLYPNTVTGMRHQWSHPAFGDSAPDGSLDELEQARDFIAHIAVTCGMSSRQLLEIADLYSSTGERGVSGSEEFRQIPGYEWEDFWRCYNCIRGVEKHASGTPFDGCSC